MRKRVFGWSIRAICARQDCNMTFFVDGMRKGEGDESPLQYYRWTPLTDM